MINKGRPEEIMQELSSGNKQDSTRRAVEV